MRIVLLVIVLWGCPKRGKEPQDLLEPLLREADAAWEARASDGFDGVENALLKGQGLLPDSPELAWRWARLRIAQGSTRDSQKARIASYGEARSLAWTCVLADPQVRALDIEVGLAEALDSLPPERHGCLAWATYAWVRWLAEFGADNAAVDLDDLDVLLAAATRTLSDEDRWLTQWSDGLLHAVRPTWSGRDPGRARSRLQRAQEDGPEPLGPLLDLYRFVGEAEADDALRSKIMAQTNVSPEDAATRARLLGE